MGLVSRQVSVAPSLSLAGGMRLRAAPVPPRGDADRLSATDGSGFGAGGGPAVQGQIRGDDARTPHMIWRGVGQLRPSRIPVALLDRG